MLEVGPDDEYLRHVLRVHGADILQVQPDFVRDPSDDDQARSSSRRATRPSGSCCSAPTATRREVLLDYVTPRYRDFSPGEFVWRASGLLARAAASAAW